MDNNGFVEHKVTLRLTAGYYRIEALAFIEEDGLTFALYWSDPVIIARYLDDSNIKKIVQTELSSTTGSIQKSLNDAINGLNELEKEFPKQDKYLSKEEYEFKNMLISARLIVKSAIRRKESRGAHSRSDYKQTNAEALHSNINRTNMKGLLYVK